MANDIPGCSGIKYHENQTTQENNQNQYPPATAKSQNQLQPGIPATLFLLALKKINESPPNITGVGKLRTISENPGNQNEEITPPDSLASAPPSYTFVLRQIATRARPRLMGTFIPSPSFIQHTPPPAYGTTYDIYVDNRLMPRNRIYNFGIASMPATCPECGYFGMTLVISKVTACTHMCACLLCVFCCWVCAPLPYIMRSCKDVYHYCRHCKTFLGIYSPTHPETNNMYR